MKNICKCGHEEFNHLSVLLDGACYKCKKTCKKFEPQADYPSDDKKFWDSVKDQQNHSHPEDKIKRDEGDSALSASTSGSDNSPQVISRNEVANSPTGALTEDTLSSKKRLDNIADENYYFESDIKNFIKKLKGLFCWYSDKEPPYCDDCPNCKRINKLAGDFK